MFQELNKEKKYYDFDEIRKAIESETDKVAGGNKGIVDLPLKLTGKTTNTKFILTSAPI